MGGVSITCRLPTKIAGIVDKSSPQQVQKDGQCVFIISGSVTTLKVVPSCPNCPPGFFPDDSLRLWVFGNLGKSLEGGLLLFLLFFGFSYFARRSVNRTTSCSR